jgi:hypothetical protein
MALAEICIVEQRRHEIDPGLDRHDMANFERQVNAQPGELILSRVTPRQDLARVADAEANHVADPVREEDEDRTLLDQIPASPFNKPNSASPSARTSAAARWTSRHSTAGAQRAVNRASRTSACSSACSADSSSEAG